MDSAHLARKLPALSDRKRKTKPRARTRRTFHSDFSAVRLNDVLYNREPEAGAPLFAGTSFIAAKKSLKNPRTRFGGNARTIIFHGDFDAA